MSKDVALVTPEGLARMKEELRERTEVRRPAIAERLQAAIKMGDLKENADYHAAKEDQAFNEGRIQELEYLVLNAQIIRETQRNDRVRIGSVVTFVELDEGEELDEESYRIVGAAEADPAKGLISNESPIGRALLGKRPGSVVTVSTPGGGFEMKIIKIE